MKESKVQIEGSPQNYKLLSSDSGRLLMIIKRMDSKQEEIAELTALLKGKLTSHQRFSMERELKAIKRQGF